MASRGTGPNRTGDPLDGCWNLLITKLVIKGGVMRISGLPPRRALLLTSSLAIPRGAWFGSCAPARC